MALEGKDTDILIHRLVAQVLEEVSDINKKLGEMSGDMSSLKSSLDRITPLVDKHETKHNQAAGALHLGKGLWTILAGSGVGAAVATALQWINGKHP